MGDVATVIDGLENPFAKQLVQRQARPSCVAVQRQPGSNTIEIVDHIKAVLPQFEAALPRQRSS